ncbi:MAG: AAA family ATPase [Candidatus Margulisbacteria bacterium]|nr:AAA family ATPase [Candidatus Margulisiibacteriota bacterium]MBU1022068.1 AAA family ATPase [Candidatus Margulisiibacteriota bacterium]MBU1729663.1 AAA family ATPase [Candidatus Margulisiibacteriota bacterium]MBU1954983.1 AAA family ATPase [Candidatus Margulisiibacteriota bacterium]
MKLKNKALLIILLICLLSSFAFALTANEYFDRATTKHLQGDTEGAIQDLNKCLELDPAHRGAKSLLPTIQNLSESEKNTNVNSPTFWLQQGLKLYDEGKYEEAMAQLNRVLEVFPTHAKATRYKILSEEKINNLAETDQRQKSRSLAQRRQQIIRIATITVLICAAATVLLGFILLLIWLIRKIKIPRLRIKFKKKRLCPVCKAKNLAEAEYCSFCGAKIKAWKDIPAQQHAWHKQQGWHKNPFTLNSIPELFIGHTEQVKTIIEKLHSKSGHILVLGPLGIGKTTLLKWLEIYFSGELNAIYISRPPKVFEDLLKLIAEELGINTKKKDLTVYNIGEYIAQTKKGLVLLLDEAHEFEPDIERPLRTLGDLDDINFVIAGLPETAEKFKKEFPPIYDRLVAEETLKPLSLDETIELIKRRIKDAGGHGVIPFTQKAVEKIYSLSKGMPRAVIKTCDWAVAQAIREEHDKIDAQIIG